MFTALGTQEVSGNNSLREELKARLIKSDWGNATHRKEPEAQKEEPGKDSGGV